MSCSQLPGTKSPSSALGSLLEDAHFPSPSTLPPLRAQDHALKKKTNSKYLLKIIHHLTCKMRSLRRKKWEKKFQHVKLGKESCNWTSHHCPPRKSALIGHDPTIRTGSLYCLQHLVKKNQKTSYRLGENMCKPHTRLRTPAGSVEIQNLTPQISKHSSQQKKKKWAKDLNTSAQSIQMEIPSKPAIGAIQM